MYNHNKKLVFVHVPRTGGTAIKNSLGGFRKPGVGYHENWETIKAANPKAWENYFKFSVVRNPWDRVYSIYSYYKNSPRQRTGVKPRELPDMFEDFVWDLSRYLGILGLNYNQCEYIGDELNFVCRFENLRNDFKYMCKLAGVTPVREFERKRESRRDPNYTNVYNSQLEYIVESYFAEDIEKYGYEY